MITLGKASEMTKAKVFGQPWDGSKALDGAFQYELATTPVANMQKIRREA